MNYWQWRSARIESDRVFTFRGIPYFFEAIKININIFDALFGDVSLIVTEDKLHFSTFRFPLSRFSA